LYEKPCNRRETRTTVPDLISGSVFYESENDLKRETPGASESYTLQTGTVTLFLSWVYFTTILGLIPSVGIYILMVDTIASNIFKVLH
jgi:hypothetical protein